MKMFLPIFLALAAPVVAQQSPESVYSKAVREYHAGRVETARALFELAASNGSHKQSAQNYLRTIAAEEKDDTSLQGALKKITLPSVDLKEAGAREAIMFVAQQIEKQSGGKQKLNVVWMVPIESTLPITLNLRDIPATEALRYIADSANLALKYDEYALKVVPANQTASVK